MKLSKIGIELLSAVCVAMPVFGAAAPDLKAEAAREGKPCMVLCVGADWCVSGESVRRVYDSAEFRRVLHGRRVRAGGQGSGRTGGVLAHGAGVRRLQERRDPRDGGHFASSRRPEPPD
ncbi:MAG: hypothetical protein IJI36_14125 [Kiritimatiellae bacterium]|nr:hypothetical protein [Kiritimatiellia bacterium]